MKVLVCGSRNWSDATTIKEELKKLPRGTTIIHGGCRGADLLAGVIANGLGFQVEEFPADWKNFGKSAGFKRNLKMLDEKPDVVIAFWRDNSKGTAHTVNEAERRGIKTIIRRN